MPVHALPAMRDGAPVGLAHLILHPDTALMATALAWVAEAGAACVTWLTRPANRAAQALYDSLAARPVRHSRVRPGA